MKRTQQGFTLIELIVVIVILGVLAVTASPKFADLTGDAKAATLGGVETALKGALEIQYSKSLINDSTTYPPADTVAAISDIAELGDFVVAQDVSTDTSATTVRIYPADFSFTAGTGDAAAKRVFSSTPTDERCYVQIIDGAVTKSTDDC
jgi:MSHA pilin protein MshA